MSATSKLAVASWPVKTYARANECGTSASTGAETGRPSIVSSVVRTDQSRVGPFTKRTEDVTVNDPEPVALSYEASHRRLSMRVAARDSTKTSRWSPAIHH